MRPQEAALLKKWILELDLGADATCLNIGSSTKHFREVTQPHLQNDFIRPLEGAGLQFVHCDMKHAEGVDEVGDILDPEFRKSLRKYGAKLLVCSNLLEHLENPALFARACGELVTEGGYGVFSVPSKYPYHPDPIDTLLRLKPDQIADLLPGWTEIRSAEIEAGSYWGDLREQGRPWRKIVRQIGRVALPFYRPGQWRANAGRLSWLFRTYKVSIILLRKPEPAASAEKGGPAATQSISAL